MTLYNASQSFEPSPDIDKNDLARVAVKLFLKITEEWSLNEDQRCVLAGLSSRTTLHNWRQRVDDREQSIKLSKDTLERLSYIAGIYKAIQILFDEPKQWQEWIKKPNSDFAGQSALDRMLAGNVADLYFVRQYLDAWRGESYV